MKIRVHNLAKEIHVRSRDMVRFLKSLGFDRIKSAQSTLRSIELIDLESQVRAVDDDLIHNTLGSSTDKELLLGGIERIQVGIGKLHFREVLKDASLIFDHPIKNELISIAKELKPWSAAQEAKMLGVASAYIHATRWTSFLRCDFGEEVFEAFVYARD